MGLTNVCGRACGVLCARMRVVCCVRACNVVQIRKHGTTKQEAKYITDKDVLQDLPHRIWLNNYPFTLLEADKFTVRYRNKGNIASLLRCAATRVCLRIVVVEECRVLPVCQFFAIEFPCTAGVSRRQSVHGKCAHAHMSICPGPLVLASEGRFGVAI